MTQRQLVLLLDEADYDTIQAELARRQQRSRWQDAAGGVILPEGESNLAGALLAEAVRDLDEYRSLYGSRQS